MGIAVVAKGCAIPLYSFQSLHCLPVSPPTEHGTMHGIAHGKMHGIVHAEGAAELA